MKETTISKNKEGYGYKYTDLAQIHEYLEQNDMKYYQYVDRVDSDDYIMTVPIIKGVEQTARRGVRIVNAVLAGIKNPAQEQGSATTYARRYSLLMAFGLATEDDDAASLTTSKEVTEEDAKKYVFGFGKHKGEKLSEVIASDNSYISWLLGSDKTDPELIKCIELLTGEKPLTKEEQNETLNLMKELSSLLDETNTDRDKFYKYYKVTSNGEMTIEQLKDGISKLKKKVGE